MGSMITVITRHGGRAIMAEMAGLLAGGCRASSRHLAAEIAKGGRLEEKGGQPEEPSNASEQGHLGAKYERGLDPRSMAKAGGPVT